MVESLFKRFLSHYKEHGFKSILKNAYFLALKKGFRVYEKLGFYVIPSHFYEPIPNTKDLIANKDRIRKVSELIGIDMNDELQLKLLDLFSKYQCEYVKLTELPRGGLGDVDREVLYCMIRHFKPSLVIEVGSGASTYIITAAILANKRDGKSSKLIVVDPYPAKSLQKMLREHNFSSIIIDKCENLNLDFFSQLNSNDILFIDSTHTIKTGGEVNFSYLEVLPRLSKGVIVHAHDIFLPSEYPIEWVVKQHRFWTEQYLLHAFLIYNSCFEVLWGGTYMHLKYPEKLKSTFLSYNPEKTLPGSFWIRRIK